MENSLKPKIIAVIVLTAAVIISFVFFIATRNNSLIPAETAAVTPSVEVETAVPSLTSEPSSVPEETPDPVPAETPEPTMDAQADDSLIKVVNAAHPVSTDYVPGDLVDLNLYSTMMLDQQQLRYEAAISLENMFTAAMQENVYFYLIKGYEASEDGTSEHALGLAADIGNYNRQCEYQECFTKYQSYLWLQEHSYEYGWIERYPQYKEDVTKVSWKPWHYRYVGVDIATSIHDSGMTLEEYCGVGAE